MAFQLSEMEYEKYPFFLQWHITERCNLSCRHCYQQSPTVEMSRKEICLAIDEFAGVMCNWATMYGMEVSPSIHFTGGEPFLHRDLFALLHHARNRGFVTSLLTNGTLITSDIAQKLREVEVEDVQVSLEGMEIINDNIRGKRSFKEALTGIQNLVAEGIDTNVNMTLSSLNYRELDPVIQLAEELGVSAVGFSRLVPCGRGKKLSTNMLTTEQLSLLSHKLANWDSRGKVELISRDPLINVANIDKYSDCVELLEINFPVGGCSAGIFGVTITADGSIMPCRRMDLSIGNIKTANFRQIWAESPVLISLRNRLYYNGNCRTCSYWAVCRGCRAIALANARSYGEDDYLGHDPQCSYYRPMDKLLKKEIS